MYYDIVSIYEEGGTMTKRLLTILICCVINMICSSSFAKTVKEAPLTRWQRFKRALVRRKKEILGLGGATALSQDYICAIRSYLSSLRSLAILIQLIDLLFIQSKVL